MNSYIMLPLHDREHECTICGSKKSVKYKLPGRFDFEEQKNLSLDMFFCNHPDCFQIMLKYQEVDALVDKCIDKFDELLEEIATMIIARVDK